MNRRRIRLNPESGSSLEARGARLIGARFGQYLVVGLLGAGGMGEVWAAEDTRLGRRVALKVLPVEFAEDPDRMARFTREAKALASLNHANIAVLYGLESLVPGSPLPGTGPSPQDSPSRLGDDARPVHALVMELVDGEGLDEMISQGPLAFHEAMDIALQVTRGLGAAHEAGIVHRDLKPANVKVRPDGRVKVLDFGLATSRREDLQGGDSSSSQSPTMSRHRHTAVGSIIGTAPYMSPEQARGKRVDRRSDIWSFGCLLYEMLTATPAFPGETLSDTMAAVLKDEPDWDLLPADLEPVARHVLRRCLSKDPARRFHDVADVRIELEEALSTPAPPRRMLSPAGWISARRAGFAAAAVIPMVIGLAAVLRTPTQPLPTFQALSFESGRVASARFAPDGTTVIYGTSTREAPLALVSTRTDSVESTRLELPPADILGISKTGKMAILLDRHCEGSWVSVGTLAEVDLAGGAPRPILERVNDGDISADGTRMAVVREHGSVQRLEYPVGTVLFETHGWLSHVHISPDGQHVAFLHHPHYGDDRGLVAVVDTPGTVTVLTEETSDSLQGLAWAPDGKSVCYSAYVFQKGGEVWSVRPGEAPVPLLRCPLSVRLQDIGPDGRILLVGGDTRAEVAGLLAGQTREHRYESWNDDSVGGMDALGKIFAGNMQVATRDGEYAAFARTSDGSPPVRLGYGDVFGMTPDGAWVFVRTLTRDWTRLFLFPTGPGAPRTVDLDGVRPDGSGRGLLSCSADGRLACFTGFTGDSGPRICLLDLDTDAVTTLGPEGIREPVLSPDGSRVAAVSPAGELTVYRVSDGKPAPMHNTLPGEVPLQWTRDSQAVLVWDRTFPAHIQRIDLEDGSRRLLRRIMPSNPAGVLYGQILLAPGGDHYVYRYRRDFSTLFLVENLS